MTLITLEKEASRLDTVIDRAEATIRDLTLEIEGLQRRVRDGDVTAIKEAQRTAADVRAWLKIATETEQQIAERRKNDAGVRGGYAIDFDDARHQIGCRLARLRRAGCPGRVSE